IFPRIATGPTTWPRSRRRCSAPTSARRASPSADSGPALLLAQQHAGERAATHVDRIRADLADGRRRPDVALGVERLALEGAVADGPDPRQDAGADKVGSAAAARARLGLVRSLDHRAANRIAAGGDAHDDGALGVLPMA